MGDTKQTYSLSFPVWNPQRKSWSLFKHYDTKIAIKHLRSSSDAFISKSEVRAFIFNRDGFKCKICGNSTALQVDHIVSVYACTKGAISFTTLNSEQNLQTICGLCNCSKKP